MFVLKSLSPALTDFFLQKLKMYDLSHKSKLLKRKGAIKFLPFFTEAKDLCTNSTKHKNCKNGVK